MEYLSYSTIIQQYPLPKESFRNQISTHLAEHKFKIIILDDDPTGIQTVHNCFLITKCTSENLQTAFDDKAPFFYILTNSRSLDPEKAKKINEDVVSQVLALNQTYHYKLIFISRSDSTLRGHFPLEPETIRKILKLKGHSVNLPTFFIPSFLEVGRFTINNVHYIRDIDNLIPVSETEFARDNVFGYQNSNLADYIIEKSKNRLDNTQIKSISLHELHTKNVDELSLIHI